MLTPSDLKNIRNFKTLTKNHKRVFKHRLLKKCRDSLKGIEYVLLSYDKLNLKVDKTIDIVQLIKLRELYEDLSKLQNG